MEEVEQLLDKNKTLDSRLSFLLNKVQVDEEARVVQAEDRKKLEAQVLSFTERCEELQQKLTETGESNRIITQAMRLKQTELNEMTKKYETLSKELEFRNANEDTGVNMNGQDMLGARPGRNLYRILLSSLIPFLLSATCRMSIMHTLQTIPMMLLYTCNVCTTYTQCILHIYVFIKDKIK